MEKRLTMQTSPLQVGLPGPRFSTVFLLLPFMLPWLSKPAGFLQVLFSPSHPNSKRTFLWAKPRRVRLCLPLPLRRGPAHLVCLVLHSGLTSWMTSGLRSDQVKCCSKLIKPKLLCFPFRPQQQSRTCPSRPLWFLPLEHHFNPPKWLLILSFLRTSQHHKARSYKISLVSLWPPPLFLLLSTDGQFLVKKILMLWILNGNFIE